MWHALLIVLLLLTAGDRQPAEKGAAETVLGPDSRLLSVQGVAIRPDGTLLVADRLDYRVKKFSPGGELKGAVGGRGRGPGQFQGPGPLDCSGSRTAVADFTTGRVQVLQDLLPISSFEVPGAVSDLCFDGAGNLWIMAVTMDRQRGLFVYGPDGKERKVLALLHGEGDLFFDAGFVAWLGKGTIAVGYYLRNSVELWDTSGRLIREFAVAGFPERAATRHSADGSPALAVPVGSVFRSMTSDGRGRLYLLGADYSANPCREVFELDRNGRICRRIRVEKSVLICADGKGGLYAVSSDRKSILRYRLKGGR
jgi:hypothetical protein